MIPDNKAKLRLYVEGYGTFNNYDWFVSGTVRSTKKRAAEDLKQLKAQLAEGKQLKEQIATLTRQRDLAVEALEAIAKKCNLDMHGDDGSLGGYAYGIWNTANSTLSIIKESEGK